MSLGQYIIIFNGEIYNYIELKELKTYGLNLKLTQIQKLFYKHIKLGVIIVLKNLMVCGH